MEAGEAFFHRLWRYKFFPVKFNSNLQTEISSEPLGFIKQSKGFFHKISWLFHDSVFFFFPPVCFVFGLVCRVFIYVSDKFWEHTPNIQGT